MMHCCGGKWGKLPVQYVPEESDGFFFGGDTYEGHDTEKGRVSSSFDFGWKMQMEY
jgi:hypothetical protein